MWLGVAVLCLASTSWVGAQPYRTVDGTDNNVANPDWGSTGEPLLRNAPVAYGDGVSTMAGATRPSARAVSNEIVAQGGSIPNSLGRSDFVWQWGQFLDHDIDLTEAHSRVSSPSEIADIAVPMGDIFFDPFSTGTELIAFTRSLFEAGSSPRAQENDITAWVDASNVYGSDTTRANELRLMDGSGKLKSSLGDLLPYNVAGLPNAGGTSDTLFLAGDVRANEQAGLAAMHTLFMREHNRLCDEIALANPGFTGEQIYQEARRIVGGLMGVITYQEFLPALLGPGALDPYTGYDAAVNGTIANEFSTASYRFGHSMLSSQLLRYSELGAPIAEGNIALADAFFNPSRLTDEGGIDPLLRGLASQVAQRIDPNIVDDVRNFLFGPPGAGGFDLASLNLQRGRDHGLPDYNALRVAYGLAPKASFADVTSRPALQMKLAATYSDVNDIDPWLGGLCEDHVPGALVGELVFTVLKDQFERLRDGDRFYYENEFTGQELLDLQKTTLAEVIRRNTQVIGIHENVFQVPSFLRGDCNQDGILDLADVIRAISYLFSGDPVFIGCEDACDTNNDGVLDISDVIFPIDYLFQNGAPPTEPFAACGQDPTADRLGCYISSACP